MKKFAALLIAGLLIVSLAACGNKTEEPAVTDTVTETTEVSADVLEPAETTTTADEASPAPTEDVEETEEVSPEVSPAA